MTAPLARQGGARARGPSDVHRTAGAAYLLAVIAVPGSCTGAPRLVIVRER